MKKYIIILSFIICQNLCAQTDNFIRISRVDTIDYENKIDGFKHKNAFRYNKLVFLVGYTKDTIPENLGKRLFVLNQNGEIIFKSKGQMDSYYFEPYFYQSSNKKNDFIIIAEIGAEYSWGAKGYYIRNNNIYNLGYLDVGILKEVYVDGELFFSNPSRINEHLIISEKNDEILIKFKEKETVILYPGTDKESEQESEKIYYKWNGTNLELIVN